MTTNIKEYKQSILDMFHSLTEIEIEATKDAIKRDPEKNSDLGTVHLMAVSRCRQILEIILEDSKNE